MTDHADRLGIVIQQDMVQHYGDPIPNAAANWIGGNGIAAAKPYFEEL